MRKLFLAFSLVLVACGALSGCANPQSNLSFARIFEPPTASEADVNRAVALAWEKYQGGAPIGSVCTDALRQLEINSQMPGYDENRCFQQIHAKQIQEQERQAQEHARQMLAQEAQERAQLEANRKAQQEAQEHAFNQHIADIRAGKATIQTPQEAAVIYNATNGDGITAQPMIHPDGRNYVLHGYLDPAGGLQSDHFVLRDAAIGLPAYAAISVDESKITLPPETHSGSSMVVIGSYEANQSFDTIAGSRRYMPVFNALFVQVLN